jgi:hypothetical protein
MTRQRAIVVHRLPHRVRLHVPGRRGDDGWWQQLAQGMQRVPAVLLARPNLLTSTLLLEFGGALEELTGPLAELGVDLAVEPVERPAGKTAPSVPWRLVTGRNLGPMFMAGTALTALAATQAVRGHILVPSITALWYASEAFRHAIRDSAPDRHSDPTANLQGAQHERHRQSASHRAPDRHQRPLGRAGGGAA